MTKNVTLFFFILITSTQISSEPKKVLCELEGDYSITYEDFRRNYFNEAVEIAKNVAVNTTQSIFFLRPFALRPADRFGWLFLQYTHPCRLCCPT